MNHELLTVLITSLLSSTGGVGLLQWFLARRQKERDDHRARQTATSENWYNQSRAHYDIARAETEEAKRQCADCLTQLRGTRMAVYTLLETLEDQIIPVLGLPGTDIAETRKAMRSAVHAAREAL